MAGPDGERLWWQEPDEQILRQVSATVLYQYADSVLRRRFPGVFFLTEHRFVGSWRGRRARTKRVLPIDVPRAYIKKVAVVDNLTTRPNLYRPRPGRRVLRLDVDHRDRALTLGLVLRSDDAEDWAAVLSADPASSVDPADAE